MPAGDGTGPMGMGPKTGRAAGFCTGSNVTGDAKPGSQFRLGLRYRGGRGWRRGFGAAGGRGWMRRDANTVAGSAPDPQWEKRVLMDQAAALKAEIEEIEKRLHELDFA